MKKNQIMTVIYFSLAVIFFGSFAVLPYSQTFIPKSAPIVFLAVWIVIHIRTIPGKILSIGFLFSATGDIFLAIDRQQFFAHGLFAFLLAHVCYTCVFLRSPKITKKRFIYMSVIVIFGVSMAGILATRTGSYTYPVMAYVSIITIMAVSALLGSKNHHWVIVGALLFMVSDSIIAIDKFIQPFAASGMLIMITYYLAQYLIALGAIKETK